MLPVSLLKSFETASHGRNEEDANAVIGLRFDGCSTAHQRWQWRNISAAAIRSHDDYFMYLGWLQRSSPQGII